MAPSVIAGDSSDNGIAYGPIKSANGHAKSYTNPEVKLPLTPNGSLDSYDFIDLTPCIGREFPTANLVDMMNASNADELLQELALTSMTCSRFHQHVH